MLGYKEKNFLNAYLKLFDLDTVIITKILLKDKNLCKLQIKMVLENGWIELDDTPTFDINKLFINLEINQNYLYNKIGEIYCL